MADWLPGWIAAVLSHGNLGVEVFFVLSGFVLAHSVRNGLFTFGYLGRFGLRPSIRLDPAIWQGMLLRRGGRPTHNSPRVGHLASRPFHRPPVGVVEYRSEGASDPAM